VYHENPLTAQSRATQTATGVLKGAVDYHDWTSGNYAKALGTLWPLDLKGAGEMRDLWKANVGRPEVTQWSGNLAGNVLGVPHASDIAQVIAPYTQFGARQTYSMLRAQAEGKYTSSKLSVAAYGSAAAIRLGPVDSALLAKMGELPVSPKIIVVPGGRARYVLTRTGAVHRATPRGATGAG
jgi:hypothetical protein